MRELSQRSLEICGCCITLGLSLAMLACLFFSVFARCDQIFGEDGGQYDCGVGIGWVLVGGVFVVIAVYSLYRLYGVWREGITECPVGFRRSSGLALHSQRGLSLTILTITGNV